jgi:hypothetical protein
MLGIGDNYDGTFFSLLGNIGNEVGFYEGTSREEGAKQVVKSDISANFLKKALEEIQNTAAS